jgi:hypothetical protein
MASIYTQRFTEGYVPLLVENADSQAIGAHPTAWADLRNYQRVVAVLNVGEMQAGATLDMLINQATDNAGTGAKVVAGKAIAQLTQAGGDGDDLVAIELRTEELDVDGGFSFIQVVPTVAGAAVEYGLVVYGFVARYEPVPTTAWTEIVD